MGKKLKKCALPRQDANRTIYRLYRLCNNTPVIFNLNTHIFHSGKSPAANTDSLQFTVRDTLQTLLSSRLCTNVVKIF